MRKTGKLLLMSANPRMKGRIKKCASSLNVKFRQSASSFQFVFQNVTLLL